MHFSFEIRREGNGAEAKNYPSWRSNIHLSKHAGHSDEKVRSERDTYPRPQGHHQPPPRQAALRGWQRLWWRRCLHFPTRTEIQSPQPKPIRIALEPLRTPARLLWAGHHHHQHQHQQHRHWQHEATTTTFRIQLGVEASRDQQRSSEGCTEKSPKKKDCEALPPSPLHLQLQPTSAEAETRQFAAPRGDGGSLNLAGNSSHRGEGSRDGSSPLSTGYS